MQQNTFNKRVLAALFLALAGFMFFWGIGKYALWDDETMTSLAAMGVIQTGDTSAVHGQNITAYRAGILLKDLHDRSTPPLSAYLCASSIKLLGPSSFSARLPFAILGFLLMIWAVFLIYRSSISALESAIWYLAISGNISLFLFMRQCRYYAPAVFMTVLVTTAYLRWRRDNRGLLLIAPLIVLLFASNYMVCAAVILCLIVDYLIWKRREVGLNFKDVFVAGLIVGIPCLAIKSVWNPYVTKYGDYPKLSTALDRLTLLGWSFRDMNAAGFMVGGLIVAALFFAILRKDTLLRRGLTALFVYTALVSSVSPQLVKETSFADIRYLAPVIPLCIALGVISYLKILGNRKVLCLLLAIPVFWTNLLQGTFLPPNRPRSVPLEYFGELLSPPPEPFTPAAEWIRNHVTKSESIWVLPDYMTYPLMFHAPDAIYAWQLDPSQRQESQFKNLPPIHFKGLQAPDYIIVFGPSVLTVRMMIQNWNKQGVNFEEVGMINTFWKDCFRPELFWRTFTPILNYDPDSQAIYIFKKS